MSTFNAHLVRLEKERRNAGAASKKIGALRRILSAKQLAFIDDPARWKVACCARQSGKTYADAAYMIMTCMMAPNTPTLYVGITRDSAKAAIWPTLIAMLDGIEVGYKALPSSLTITLYNGSTIVLFGGDTPQAKNRLRGRQFKLIVGDETGFYVELDPLVDALLPTLAARQGTLALTSSPGEIFDGMFYHAYLGDRRANWSQHQWTMLDNPLFQKPANDPKYGTLGEQELDLVCVGRYGGKRDHPAFEREWLGRYTRDKSRLVYPYDETNIVDSVPKLDQPKYALGIDLGSVSANAIVVAQYSYKSRQVTFVDEWKEAGVSIDYLAAEIQRFIDLYNPLYIIADTGGYGKGIVDELKRRYSFPIIPAIKTDKAYHQRIMANDIMSGYIKVMRDSEILTEAQKILKDEQGDELPAENHCCDAHLYAYKKIYVTHLQGNDIVETAEDAMFRSVKEQLAKDAEAAAEGW